MTDAMTDDERSIVEQLFDDCIDSEWRDLWASDYAGCAKCNGYIFRSSDVADQVCAAALDRVRPSAQTSPHVHHALNGPLGDAGIAGAGALEPLAVSLMPTRIATAVLARRFEEKFGKESSNATECKKAMGKRLAVRPHRDWKLNYAVLDKEMEAFDNMRGRFRSANRYGRLSARDRNSELGQYFLHANPYKQEEVRKEYKGTLRDMWSAWVAAQPVGGAQPVEECVVM